MRLEGTGWAWSLCSISAAAAFVGAAGPVQVAFPVIAVLVGIALVRRSGGEYLEYVLWLWLLTPELRRIVDLASGWHPVSPIMAVAPIVSCAALVPALLRSGRLKPGGTGLFLVALLSLAYGTAVGVLLVGPGPAGAAVLNWLPPVALGLYVANAGPGTNAVRAVLRRVATTGVLVLSLYALVQFFFLPEWDRFWMLNAELASIGRPEPLEVRVFSILNSPGPFATVLAALLTVLLGVHGRGVRRTTTFALGFVALALSLVRGAWLAFLVSSTLLFLRRNGRGALRLLSFLALPVIALGLVGGPVAETITDRLVSTREAGAADQSFGDRIELYRTQTLAVLSEPFGAGLGSVGTATKVGNDGRLTDTGNFDSGVLEYPYTFGALVGGVYLLTLVVVAARACRSVRRDDDFAVACAAAVTGLLLQLLLVNITTAVSGVFLWVLLGLILREETAAPSVTAVPPLQARDPVSLGRRHQRSKTGSAL